MVPVQSEQWSPPIRARIFLRFGLVDGSSLHGSNAESPVIEIVIERSMRGSRHSEDRRRSPGRFAYRFATCHPKARLLNRIDEALLLHELRIVEHTSLPIIERHGCHPYAGLLFNEALDCICARVAVHALNFEDRSFHSMLPSCTVRAGVTYANPWSYLPGQHLAWVLRQAREAQRPFIGHSSPR